MSAHFLHLGARVCYRDEIGERRRFLALMAHGSILVTPVPADPHRPPVPVDADLKPLQRVPENAGRHEQGDQRARPGTEPPGHRAVKWRRAEPRGSLTVMPRQVRSPAPYA